MTLHQAPRRRLSPVLLQLITMGNVEKAALVVETAVGIAATHVGGVGVLPGRVGGVQGEAGAGHVIPNLDEIRSRDRGTRRRRARSGSSSGSESSRSSRSRSRSRRRHARKSGWDDETEQPGAKHSNFSTAREPLQETGYISVRLGPSGWFHRPPTAPLAASNAAWWRGG